MTTEPNVLEMPPEQIEDTRHQLISSRRVEGTRVFNPQGDKLGTIHSVMLDKRSGRTAYAVLAFGGFLGTNEFVHPIPWDLLDYDEERDGYVVNLTSEQLDRAPVFRLDQADRPRRSSDDEAIYQYYGMGFPFP